MKLSRTPIAAALCCMALASAPYALAAGDTASTPGTMGTSHSMNSDTVRQVQQALSAKGHNPGPVDGIMGSRTQAALQAYQRSQNLTGAKGMDQQTLQSLGVQANASGGAGSMAGSGDTTSGSTARAPGNGGSSAGGSGSSTGGSGGGQASDGGSTGSGSAGTGSGGTGGR